MQEQIQAIADQFNLDKDSLAGMMEYLQKKALEYPDLFLQDPKLFIETGVRKYHEMMVEFYSDMLYGKTDRAKKLRAQLAAEVWTQLRSKENA